MPARNAAATATEFDEIDTVNLDDFDAPLDLSGINENAGFSILPPGIYDATIDNVEFTKSQSSGNPMWTWVFKVADPDSGRERTLFFHTVFTEGGLPRLKKTLMQVAPDIDLSALRPKTDCNALIGRSCRVKIKTRNYDGQNRNEVKDVLAASEGDAMSFLS